MCCGRAKREEEMESMSDNIEGQEEQASKEGTVAQSWHVGRIGRAMLKVVVRHDPDAKCRTYKSSGNSAGREN
jgi:hypothetical protein